MTDLTPETNEDTSVYDEPAADTSTEDATEATAEAGAALARLP